MKGFGCFGGPAGLRGGILVTAAALQLSEGFRAVLEGAGDLVSRL